MKLKRDRKFGEESTRRFKIGKRNLANFDLSTRKSQGFSLLSNCAIIGCNLSKKRKLTQYKTQNGESNYVDHNFFFNFYQE